MRFTYNIVNVHSVAYIIYWNSETTYNNCYILYICRIESLIIVECPTFTIESMIIDYGY